MRRLSQTFDTEAIAFPVFVPLNLWRGGKQPASMVHAWNCLLPELSFSDCWWKGNKDSGNKTDTEKKYLLLLPISPYPTYLKMESSR